METKQIELSPSFDNLIYLLGEYKMKYPRNKEWKKCLKAFKGMDLSPIKHLFEYVNFLNLLQENPDMLNPKVVGEKITGYSHGNGYLHYVKPAHHAQKVVVCMWLYVFYNVNEKSVKDDYAKDLDLLQKSIKEISELPRLSGADTDKITTIYNAMGIISDGNSPSRNMNLLLPIYFANTKLL